MVSGIINQKTVNETIKDVHFVAYELIKPIKAPLEQLTLLSLIDVEVVLYRKESQMTNELLSSILIDWREKYNYEIDGVIVTDNKVYERTVGNPEYAFAFKMVLSDQIAEAKVVDVIWTASKDGYLKPRVQIEPIQLGGVKIEYATGFNGSFVNDNKVGVGSIIQLIRSGDVIPHIQKIVVPAEQAKMPSVPYKWNDTHIDILLVNVDSDETVKEKNITGFFKGIGVDGLSTGNIARIMKGGFDSVPKIIRMNMNDFLKVEGFKITTATKLYEGIREKLCSASLVTIMAASNLFGRGFSEKKLEVIMEHYPEVLVSNESTASKVSKVCSIKGMAEKTADAFVERIHPFVSFAKEIGVIDKLFETLSMPNGLNNSNNVAKANAGSHPLFGKTIVITGFRDKVFEDKIKVLGAKLGASVSKNTFCVIAKDPEMGSGKVLDAQKVGIPIMDMNTFTQKYM
jgi:NAD-dependent DNA ligase